MVDFNGAARRIAAECPALRVREASRSLTRMFDEILRPVGIQASQLSVLVAVAMFGERGATLGALARALVMDRTTLTRNVRPLEKSGLLQVARSPHDSRTRVVSLTRAGERMIESAYPAWEQAEERVRKLLGARRLKTLRAELAELVSRASGA